MLGVDVGGTFTDIIASDELGNTWSTKAFSTSPDPSVGVISGLDKIANLLGKTTSELLANTTRFVYGTTVWTAPL
jgi:N-methylhydantoinase A